MKYVLSAALLLSLAIPAFSQAIGTAMRTTNGYAFGTTVIGGDMQSTNRISTNRISGKLMVGDTNFSILGTENLIINNRFTNPVIAVQQTRSHMVVGHTAVNSNLLHNGIVSFAGVATNNTADWTNSQYPQLTAFNGSVQPEQASSGIIRRAAVYSGTVGGAVTEGNGAIIDEGVVFWGDTANGAGNSLSNIVIFKGSGLAAGWNNTGLWLGIEQETYPQTGNWAIWDETTYPTRISGNLWTVGGTNGLTGKLAIGPTVGAVGVGSTNWLDITSGTMTTGSKAVSVFGTLADSTASETGVGILVSGSGSGAGTKTATSSVLLAGYTGGGATAGGAFGNASAGTGSFGFDIGPANWAVNASSSGTTVGNNVSVFGRVQGSSTLNLGIFGHSVSVANFPLLNVGVAGQALNATTSIGGFFQLGSGTPSIGDSAALMADNGATSGSIALWRDNGTVVGGIGDGGIMYGNAAGVSNAVDLIASGCIQITTNANGRTFTLSIAGSGSDVLTNNRAAATLSGLTLTGITTNGATGGSNWVGGISLWNPATGNTINLTNGNITYPGAPWFTNPAAASSISNAYSVKAGTAITATSSTGGFINSVRDSSTAANGALRFLGNDGLIDGSISYNNNVGNSLTFETGAGAAATRMTISDGGNVGIGTTTPQHKLEVVGTIGSTNTATANTALTLNGAASGATGAVISFDTNNVNKVKFDTSGNGTLAGSFVASSFIQSSSSIIAGAGNSFNWNGRSALLSPANGRVQVMTAGGAAGAQLEALNAVLTNGVVMFASDNIPTNSIPASTAAYTNWVHLNWTNTGPVYVATNIAASGSFLLRVPTTSLSAWP